MLIRFFALLFMFFLLWNPTLVHSEEPALPEGLGSSQGVERTGTDEPELPAGPELSGNQTRAFPPLNLSGFLEGRLGTRLEDDPYQDEHG